MADIDAARFNEEVQRSFAFKLDRDKIQHVPARSEEYQLRPNELALLLETISTTSDRVHRSYGLRQTCEKAIKNSETLRVQLQESYRKQEYTSILDLGRIHCLKVSTAH
jgi:hypothetical protein